MSLVHLHLPERLLAIYDLLISHFGNLAWWPGESPFEIIVGAVLTQNTAWRNVEYALANLKSKGLLSPERILETEDRTLSNLIRPSGYYNIKTQRLKSFVKYLFDEYNGNLDLMFSEELWYLREKLLSVRGIGEETADSILLYAGEKLIFVVDAYTRRIMLRHNVIDNGYGYSDIQNLFMRYLPPNINIYKQYHALLVQAGKDFCRISMKCHGCPLKEPRESAGGN